MSSGRYQVESYGALGARTAPFDDLRLADSAAVAAVRDGAIWGQLLRLPVDAPLRSASPTVVATYFPIPCGSCPGCESKLVCWMPRGILVDRSSRERLS